MSELDCQTIVWFYNTALHTVLASTTNARI
jgi:hypothetical protein